MKKTLLITVSLLLILAGPALAAKGGNKPERNEPLIEKVAVDFNNMEILIFGQYLRGDVDPEITLSGLPIDLSVNDTGAVEEVIAVLPNSFEDADYLLILTTESGSSSIVVKIYVTSMIGGLDFIYWT